MKNEIKEKLKIIDDLYPAERLEKSKKRLENLWLNKPQNDRNPFTIYPANHNPYWGEFEPYQRLNIILDDYICRGEVDDDTIPTLFTGCRTSTIPNMFGAKELIVNGDITAENLFSTVDEMRNIPQPKIQGVTQMWLDMMKFFIDETDGTMPIHVTDSQGPLDVAGVLLHYDNFFVTAYEDEDLFREVLQKLTDAFIMFFEAQTKLLGNLCVPTHLMSWDYVPVNFCASMSVDSLVMLSPDFYKEFIKETIEQVATKFNRIMIHSCGNWTHMVKSICETKGVCGINASQMDLKMLKNGGLTRDTVAIVMSSIDKACEEANLAKELNLRINLSVLNMFDHLIKPTDYFLLNEIKPKNEWTRKDRDILKDREKQLKDALSI